MKLPILEIKQPLGVFYALKINAKDLLRISDSDPYRVSHDKSFKGIQRPIQEKRLKEISEYLKGVESALPNSIIIAANTHNEDDDSRWKIIKEGGEKFLFIPKTEVNSTIIDGQHRVNGFKLLPDELKENYELLCSVYLDLPNPYQAYIFATVNMNQRKVDKSLAYELYGYNLDEEESNSWTPEKLGVYLSRRLNFDEESCFYKHIIVAAENDEILFDISPKKNDWYVSTATIVNGILSLITTNEKRDRDKLHQFKVEERKRSLLESDSTPLRDYYIDGNDLVIYKIVNNFFNESHQELYKKDSYLFKTVGIQAQFRFLKTLLKEKLEEDKDISREYYRNVLKSCKDIDFKDNFFTASGIGASRIANAMLIATEMKSVEEINKDTDRLEYSRILDL